jgi:hypothetical protein
MKLLHRGNFEVTSFALGKIHRGMVGITNSFGMIVDLELLSQTPNLEGFGWLGRERYKA